MRRRAVAQHAISLKRVTRALALDAKRIAATQELVPGASCSVCRTAGDGTRSCRACGAVEAVELTMARLGLVIRGRSDEDRRRYDFAAAVHGAIGCPEGASRGRDPITYGRSTARVVDEGAKGCCKLATLVRTRELLAP